MEIKFKKKCFKRLTLLVIQVITAITILETVSCFIAESKALNKRRAIDYDEHFGFGLMNDDTSGRHHGHYPVVRGDDKNFENSDEDLKKVSEKVTETDIGRLISTTGHSASKPQSNSRELPYPPDSDGIVYIGCYHTWLLNKMKFPYSKDDDQFTYKTCSEFCQGRDYQLSLLKGLKCLCSHMSSFSLVKLDENYCNVPCPVSSIPEYFGSSLAINETCGGNYYYSLYCKTSSLQDCTNVPTIPLITNELSSPKLIKEELPRPLIECASCKDPNVCFIPFTSPSYDYFPTNDPKSCINFCRFAQKYIANNKEEVRAPTKYASLTWKEDRLHVLPICRCVSELSHYELKNSDYCKTPCPGDPTKICGNSNTNESPVYVTIHCTNDPCDGFVEQTTQYTTVVTSEISTTENEITSEICIDCGSTSTSKEVTGTSTMSTTTTNHWTTDPEVTTSTTSIPIPSMPPVEIGCNIICRGTERNGRHWEVCAGSHGEKECGHENATGLVIWKCMDDGQFETDQPDYSGCHSSWVGDMEDQASKINDTASALKYLTELKTVLKSESAGTTTYFGHEINNVTTILRQVVQKAENVTTNVGKFEQIAKTVIDVSQHLITTREPWFEIGHAMRSKVSTDIIDTMENTSIYLTSKVNLLSDGNSYQTDLSQPSPGYYVSAGAMLKSQKDESQNGDFEFPMLSIRSPQESFIKLPSNWKDYVPGEKIEFIGMLMDPEYANLMMPGQFKRLGVDASDDKETEGQNIKIINSQLMSLTLASSENRKGWALVGDDKKLSIGFKDKGVEITFEHDLEAWGDGAVNIRRKLHPGETRKAALGTSQCVYWDPTNSIWSPDGCKLVSSNRFHTVCSCNHLTSFAILMDAHNYVGKELGLEVLTLILCSLSFICLFVSVMIFSTIRGVKNLRTTITKNLSICLLVGNTLVLLVLDRNYLNMSDGLCIASGIISHYVFLSAFIWMAIEGIHLYKMVVHVFDTENNPLNIYRVISYGLPLIIVAVTVVIGYLKGDRPYGGDVVCWLDGPYIWSFMVPVALVVMANFVILFIALKTAYQLQHNTHMPVLLQSRVRSLRTWIRGCFSITVLLGLTWLVGFFTLIPAAPGVAAAYIFTILNASQGVFIFVFHCVLNDKVRFVTSKRFGSYLPSWFSSSMNNNSSGSQGNEASGFGKRTVSNMKSSNSNSDFVGNEKSTVNKKEKTVEKIRNKLKFPTPSKNIVSMDATGGNGTGEGLNGSGGSISVITPIQTRSKRHNLMRRRESLGTVSSVDSLRPEQNNDYSSGSISDSGNNTDNSLRVLISDKRSHSRF